MTHGDGVPDNSFMPPLKQLVLFVTEACNFNCDYCFQGLRTTPRKMDPKTARKSVDWLLAEASGDARKINIGFFGGEPLVNFPLIEEIVDYAEQAAPRYDKTVAFNMTTNGSLFTDKVADFWKRHDISLLLSVDGAPFTQNRHRKSKHGADTSAQVEKNFARILDVHPDCMVRMTITPDTMDHLVDNLDYLFDHGFRAFAHHPVDRGWDRQSLLALDVAVRKAANWCLDKLLTGMKFKQHPFSATAARLCDWDDAAAAENSKPKRSCGAGKGLLAVGVDGTIFPCHRFVSHNDFAGAFPMGTVFDGLNRRMRNQFTRLSNQKMLGCSTTCDACKVRSVCRGGCLARNWEVNGSMFMPAPELEYIATIYYETTKELIGLLETHRRDLLPILLGRRKRSLAKDRASQKTGLRKDRVN